MMATSTASASPTRSFDFVKLFITMIVKEPKTKKKGQKRSDQKRAISSKRYLNHVMRGATDKKRLAKQPTRFREETRWSDGLEVSKKTIH